MTEKDLKYLSDILRSIELIEEFTSVTTSFSEYIDDLKTQSAVERQLSIIGEAVKKFCSKQSGYTLEHSEKITGFRNRLIHAYDSIDPSIVWVIIKRYLPDLKKEINNKYLNEIH
ncbi:MAG: DUF86 domain-containing protein [Prolixibacteraceae bacterium]|nr:DUF86 domain-containing protein [Prolixibacteraceae bacterium]